MSRFFTSLLCICLLLPALHSCKGGLPPEVATEHGLIKQAIEALEKDYNGTRKMDAKKVIAVKLADLYSKTNNYTKAEIYYRVATNDGAEDPQTYYKYAQILKSRDKYEEAIEQLEKYTEAVPGDANAATEIELCKQAISWQEKPLETRYRVEEEKFLSNGKFHDYAPVIMPEGLVFSSNRTGDKDNKLYNATEGSDGSEWFNGEPQSDLFIAREQRGRKSNSLAHPEILETEELINTAAGEGAAAFDDKAKMMIYTSCNRPYVKNELDRNDSNCVLMESERKGKSWSEPERLAFCTDSSKHIFYGQPSLSEDAQTLYFASNMPGGYGGYDIWMCTYVKRSKTWSDPINLGPQVNSAKDEMYPHIYDNALYFSSNGHPGIGGLDLFVSYGRGNEWSAPKNLLAPMNSSGDDFSIFFERDKKKTRRTGDYGYFASNRGSGSGIDNIYSFTVVPLNFTVAGYVYDKKTTEVIPNAKVTLTNFDDTTKVFVNTNEVGYYFMKLDPETDYSLHPYKERYEQLDDTDPTVSTYGYYVSMDFDRDMYLTPMRPVFELNIQYDLDSFVIRYPDAAHLLDSFAVILKEHYYTQMELSSHTDARGSDEYNEKLAQKRADAAVNYLVSKGIERERFVAKGYGEYKPKTIKVNDPNNPLIKKPNGKYVINGDENSTNTVTLTEAYINKFQNNKELFEALHQLNRRTEIKILNYDYVPKETLEEDAQIYVDPDLLLEEEEKGDGEGDTEGEGDGE